MRRLALLALCGVLGLVSPAEAALSIGRLYHAPTHWRGYGDTPTLGENLATQVTPGGGGTTYTCAYPCSPTTLQNIITNQAANGDTIQLPAGTLSWSSGVTVTGKGLTIKGVGTPNTTPATSGASASCAATTITASPTTGSLFVLLPNYGNATSRLSCMTLANAGGDDGSYSSPVSVEGLCAAGGCPNLRIDNVTIPGNWAGKPRSNATAIYVANMFGVADHNTLGDTQIPGNYPYLCAFNIGHGAWQGVGGWGDKSWAMPVTWGTEQSFYLENNVFKWVEGTDVDITGSSGGGARLACRFNTFDSVHEFGACSGHGTDTAGRARGVRQWEGYYNTVTCRDTPCGSLWPGRSGVGMSFANTVANAGTGNFKGIVDANPQRTWRAVGVWGYCSGLSPWDTNDGVEYYSGTIQSVTGDFYITVSGSPGWTTNQWAPTGAVYSVWINNSFAYALESNTADTLKTQNNGGSTPVAGQSIKIYRATVCLDQSTRGGGVLLSGETPTPSGPVNQSIEGIYQAADTLPATATWTVGSAFGSIINNRDYFSETINQAANSCTGGVCSPFTGAGSASSAAGHGTLANRPTTCTTGVGYWATDQGTWNESGSGGQGRLYVCTAPNTWTLHYTPYAYPHPLTR